ncbi:hypothetical protein PMV_166 [Port-miou virus]|uniref:Uncharacterized protein n=1 Tax=Port-miou virus TaxID=1733873 RepID=A0A0N7G2E0_9VIRU|nr:hypothetical protein PMV_166 [Port-miou virus]
MDRFLEKKEVLVLSLATGTIPETLRFVEWRRKMTHSKKTFEQILPDGTKHGEFYQRKGSKCVKKVRAGYFMGKLHGSFRSKVEDWTGICVATAEFVHGSIEKMTISCPDRKNVVVELMFSKGYPIFIIEGSVISEIFWNKKKRRVTLQGQTHEDIRILDTHTSKRKCINSAWITTEYGDPLEVYVPTGMAKKVYSHHGRITKLWLPVFSEKIYRPETCLFFPRGI